MTCQVFIQKYHTINVLYNLIDTNGNSVNLNKFSNVGIYIIFGLCNIYSYSDK